MERQAGRAASSGSVELGSAGFQAEEAVEMAGEVANHFAVIAEAFAPGDALTVLGHVSAEDVAGINQCVVSGGAAGVQSPARVRVAQPPIRSDASITDGGFSHGPSQIDQSAGAHFLPYRNRFTPVQHRQRLLLHLVEKHFSQKFFG